MQVNPQWAEEFPEWAERWATLAGRMAAQAQARGGTATIADAQVRLHAPHESDGSCLRVVCLEEETARIVGEEFSVVCSWALSDDDPNNVLPEAVIAIMDGRCVVAQGGMVHIMLRDSGIGVGDALSQPTKRALAPWRAPEKP